MIPDKQQILNRIGYTELVYSRINKKLGFNLSKSEIEDLILKLIKDTPIECFQKIEKNYYITNTENKTRITVNSNSFRVITVDRIK